MVGVVDQAAQFGDAGGGFGGHCGILGHRVWWMRALAWYSRLEWQAATRRRGFSRELFGRDWTVWQKLAAEAAPARAVATRLQGGSRPAPWRLPDGRSGGRRRVVTADVGGNLFPPHGQDGGGGK